MKNEISPWSIYDPIIYPNAPRKKPFERVAPVLQQSLAGVTASMLVVQSKRLLQMQETLVMLTLLQEQMVRRKHATLPPINRSVLEKARELQFPILQDTNASRIRIRNTLMEDRKVKQHGRSSPFDDRGMVRKSSVGKKHRKNTRTSAILLFNAK